MSTFAATGSFSFSFLNEHIVYEKIINCTVKDYEFNLTFNPSLLASGSSGKILSIATGSDFHPYVTTIGLYNDTNDLLAVGKFPFPLPVSQDTDTTYLIKLDF